MFITVKASAYKIYNCNNSLMCQPARQLSSNQGEADTIVIFAAKFAQEIVCGDAVIFTVDSDIANLACYSCPNVGNQVACSNRIR